MGSELAKHHQLCPDVHLNSAALSRKHQSTVRAPLIPTMDSKLFLSKLQDTTQLANTADRARVRIEPMGCKAMIDFLVTYLKYNLELKGPLPKFRLPGKAFLWTEAQQIFPNQRVPDICDLTLESLRSLIDGEGMEVSWMLMENYYELLQETFHSDDSSVMISNHHSIRYIYQVSEIFQALPTNKQVFTTSLFREMLPDPDVTKILASESSLKIMMFPFYYLPDKQFLLRIVLQDSG